MDELLEASHRLVGCYPSQVLRCFLNDEDGVGGPPYEESEDAEHVE